MRKQFLNKFFVSLLLGLVLSPSELIAEDNSAWAQPLELIDFRPSEGGVAVYETLAPRSSQENERYRVQS